MQASLNLRKSRHIISLGKKGNGYVSCGRIVQIKVTEVKDIEF